ncbi:30S ribosomal protein S4 [Candidatus Peregrinibacteria bacterium]|jgi:small subunit ribosomal protein S4|nr:30S ribosomal protein S4 [Candidatus Peregrinibacteria bacterium]MBT7483615.1 30S ribosomal protein S4 [Candidatus Peregrinibacteria bacterium]MBT7702892.1 30S ribosomal protein S4 [Candidatus Peregrinibacteria bacterium]
MSRYIGPRARHCRRFGTNIYGSDKFDKILGKRNYPPGMHGQGRFKKKSEYAKQLDAKQMARFMFGVNEKQFRRYYSKADRSPEVTGEQLLRLLEIRLDNLLFRAGFGITRAQCRQMASHGLINVNGTRVTVPSIQVRIGDKIEIRKRSANSPLFADLKGGKTKIKPPSWLKVEAKTLTIEVLSIPAKDELEQSIDSQLIVEFYSK